MLRRALSYLRRELQLDVPHAACPFVFHNVVDVPCQGGGFLGSTYDPLQINVDAEKRAYSAEHSSLPSGQSVQSLQDRRRLLVSLQERRSLPRVFAAGALQFSSDKRFSCSAVESFAKPSIFRENRADPRSLPYDRRQSPSVRRRRGQWSRNGFGRQMRGQNLLLARRLVEAGVPFVNVFDFRQQGQNWDAHHQNFEQHKRPPVAGGRSVARGADRRSRRARIARHDVGRGDGRVRSHAKINTERWPRPLA